MSRLPEHQPSYLDFLSTTDNFHFNGQVEERVRVDRKLFEKLLFWDELSQDPEAYKEDGPCMSADDFFGSIMRATNTEITWPSRLRLNSRSRRDPHIRITGEREQVAEAKGMINSALDTRKNRVTLKMDIAFTDHSHIIGKGGRSIQKVMDDTGTHIHFPDCNRTSTFEKSNQVSIAGTALGAEQARCRVRELLPITVIYDIPLNELKRNSVEAAEQLQAIQKSFGICINFRSSHLLPFTSCVSFEFDSSVMQVAIRGSRSSITLLRQGVACLLNHLTGGLRPFNSTTAIIETEIAIQHHAFVKGRDGVNIRQIKQQTGSDITFPEHRVFLDDYLAPTASALPNRRSNVVICAPNFDSAFDAWQDLQMCLPLVLIFDLPEGTQVDGSHVQRMMDQNNVSILVKPKQKQNSRSVTVRAAEKDSRLLFEVRRQLLNLDASEVPFCCDKHYWNEYLHVSANGSKTSTSSLASVLKFQNPLPSAPDLDVRYPLPSRTTSSEMFRESRSRAPFVQSPMTAFKSVLPSETKNTDFFSRFVDSPVSFFSATSAPPTRAEPFFTFDVDANVLSSLASSRASSTSGDEKNTTDKGNPFNLTSTFSAAPGAERSALTKTMSLNDALHCCR